MRSEANFRRSECQPRPRLGSRPASASAFHLKAGDRWMAGSAAQPDAAGSQVVCISRFLIRQAVPCAHLASRFLGIVLRHLTVDFARAHAPICPPRRG